LLLLLLPCIAGCTTASLVNEGAHSACVCPPVNESALPVSVHSQRQRPLCLCLSTSQRERPLCLCLSVCLHDGRMGHLVHLVAHATERCV
jgi:hypothetical protein